MTEEKLVCEMCEAQMSQEEHDYCDICGKCLDQE